MDMDMAVLVAASWHLHTLSPSHSLSLSVALSRSAGGVWNSRNVHKLRFTLSSLKHIIYHTGKKEEVAAKD